MSIPSTEVKSLKEVVSEKIKAQFVSIIPDETWAQMIDSEVDLFINGRGRKGEYGYQEPELSKLIQAELKEIARKTISAELSKPEWQAKWVDGRQVASESVKQAIRENADVVIASLIGGLTQQMVENIKYNIR